MKTRSFLLAAGFVLALAFTFSCDSGGGGGGGNPADPNNPNNGGGTGKLTITGLPNEEGWNVVVYPAGTDISTTAAIQNAIKSAEDSKNRVWGGRTSNDKNDNVFIIAYLDNQTKPYKESGSREVVLMRMDPEATSLTSLYLYYRATVTFSNGSTTVPFSSFTLVTDLDIGGGSSSSGGGSNANVVGTWKGTYTDAGITITITIVLNANGTWDNSNEMSGTTYTNSGTYTVQGNTIYATSPGYLQTWTVSGNTMSVPIAGASGSQGGTAILRKQ
jgi:hypothetical protein